jgi:hypothetical protein
MSEKVTSQHTIDEELLGLSFDVDQEALAHGRPPMTSFCQICPIV